MGSAPWLLGFVGDGACAVDVDAVVRAVEAAGAGLVRPVETKFYGDRTGNAVDPFGHIWHVATHVEERRAADSNN
jgi:uncharacterized glyoxalase superfamily protein PhnB